MLTIDLLRHGQTAADTSCLYGATDVSLSDHGKNQLTAAFQAIHQEPVTHVASSPLQRCAWLANKVTQHSPNTVTTSFDQGFREMDFGNWEGENIQMLIQQENHFRQDVTQLSPPNGESFQAFSHRVTTAWQHYIQQHLKQGGHHLLITHGGVIRVLLGLILHIPKQHLGNLFIPHATWSRITFVSGEKPMLWFMNRHAE